MKYLLLLADGMADYPIPELNNQTPLQYAKTPNMDQLAKVSQIGLVATIPPGFPPGSDVANLSVMGYDPQKYYTGRSPLEAVSMGVKLGDQDLALRCNLVTLSNEANYSDKTMVDYSSGEISSEESAELIGELSIKLGTEEFNFFPGISYRHLMVWRNGGSREIILTPPHDISDQIIGKYLPRGKYGQTLLDIMEKSEAILKDHPVNQARRQAGKNPATSAWFWGEGKKPSLTSFADKYGVKGSVVAAVDLIKGLGICAGLTPIEVPGATGGVVTNFSGKAQAALNELKRGQDFVYVHIEAPDEAGHQGSLEHKIWAIEQIDSQVIGPFIDEMHNFPYVRFLLLPDHPTPLSIRTHSSEPVPFLLYDSRKQKSYGIEQYQEKSAEKGPFIEKGHQLMDLFIKEKID
ncbi:MAG: cofactor-independent phosphoglycerate mutase [Syntrophomonadaceae bacterium]